MIKKILLINIAIFTLTVGALTQNCGTKIPDGFFTKIQKSMQASSTEYATQPDSLPHVNLSIAVYMVNFFIPDEVLSGVLDSLNEAFEPIGISFSICKTDTVSEPEFAVIDYNQNEKQLTSLHHTNSTINLYFVNDLIGATGPACGYAYLPHDPPMDYLFVKRDCGLTKVLIHEMGHFFGLLHPHETQGGKELVNGSNCETAGDLVCDTDASPNLDGVVSEYCEYSRSLKDENGDYYLPSVTNHMSYSLKMCRCKFTPGQYKRMVRFYWSHMQHLR